MNKTLLRTAFNEFLGRENWTLWITITFRNPTTKDLAHRRFKYFLKTLNNDQEEFYAKYVYAVIFYEFEGFRKGVHIHSIVNNISSDKARLLEAECKRVFGESKVVPMHEGVKEYLAKKYGSAKLADFDYLKINSKYRGHRKERKEYGKANISL